jgi:hypothetical protein
MIDPVLGTWSIFPEFWTGCFLRVHQDTILQCIITWLESVDKEATNCIEFFSHRAFTKPGHAFIVEMRGVVRRSVGKLLGIMPISVTDTMSS